MTPARQQAPRGWVEVRTVRVRAAFTHAVYDMTEDRTRVRMVFQSDDRHSAILWALRWAALTGRQVDCREVFHHASGRLKRRQGVPDGL
ncbi:hypothetical protein [Paracoccus zeaxanthinifaciens]|uniref:hypothetical protein n=1 Tax=Paracoccus zeaxanthinifaciens TaxID=187400 RepID=UPI0003B643A8|nr:hypothetical protein [Paracoccus zeaxanthinifaciens]